ncbi:MAG: hypothetical protein JW764_04265 [Chlorobiaceae bacterium]|nr:hypothetical protein [Chlorobiaceae bacterium]
MIDTGNVHQAFLAVNIKPAGHFAERGAEINRRLGFWSHFLLNIRPARQTLLLGLYGAALHNAEKNNDNNGGAGAVQPWRSGITPRQMMFQGVQKGFLFIPFSA